jgi:uncharacterized membrane protein
MSRYKARLTRDLDRWIAEGLVPAASREPVLAGVPEPVRLGAAAALAVVGALLLGIAVIAFIAANWGAIPRLARFVMVLAAFLGVAGAGAWAAGANRPMARNVLLMLAALVYAAAIGLVGQIFDIAGDPKAALRGAGIAAFILALAGRSSAAAIAGLALIGLGDLAADGEPAWARWIGAAGIAAAAMAHVWRSRPLAHAAGIALIVGALLLGGDAPRWVWLGLALVFAGAAFAARLDRERDGATGSAFYGWAAAGALILLGVAGFERGGAPLIVPVIHRVALLAASTGVLALGRHDRQGGLVAAGALGLAITVWVILSDLGLGLLTASGVFAACAMVALATGFLLHRRARP